MHKLFWPLLLISLIFCWKHKKEMYLYTVVFWAMESVCVPLQVSVHPLHSTGSLLLAVPVGHSLSFLCLSIYSWKHERTVPTPSQFLFTGALRITVMTEITSKQQEKNIFLNEQQLQENNYFFLSRYQAHIFPLLIIFHCKE